jgi:RNA polymerase sigma-70 factor (ECF subfamily)|nr:sigma-70 family RNA polymerase sigma factor [Thiosulfatihalobacter marinus]
MPRRGDSRDVITAQGASYSEQTTWMLAVRDRQDRAAFAALFDHYAPRVKGMLIRQNCSHGQADEIVQDVMLTVWRKAAQFDPERAQVSAWIYQIARNRHIDVIRKESRPMPEELAHEPDNEPDASQILGMEQEAARLKEALARLKPAQREMIEAAYLGDLSHRELSEQTGLPLGTIKSRIRLGLDKLRHELKGMRAE